MNAATGIRSISSATARLAAGVGLISLASLASAADQTIDLPAGLACSDFDLRVEITGAPQVERQFTDKNGNVVRMLVAGKGSILTFTNLSTGASLTLKPNGSVSRTTFNQDQSTTNTTTGHNVLILFPSDVPAGPTTTLYVGRVVYGVDTSGVFTVQRTSGRTVDICAALG
jgi:hypothetical protein